MNFLTVKQFSNIWEISERRIIKLCTEGRISGAIKNGKTWIIPENTIKPADKRNNISKYINTEKRIAIINCDMNFMNQVTLLLKQSGFLFDLINVDKNTNILELEKNTNKYYEGLIFFGKNILAQQMKEMINIFSKKMHCDSSIVYVALNQDDNLKFIEDLSKKLKLDVGLRINAIKLNIPFEKNILVKYNEISEDIVDLLTKFKNSTGMIIETDGNYLEFDNNGRTKDLSNGEFYSAIETCFKDLDKNSLFWSASTMLEDEWTEEPKEMKFRVSNLDMANRGIKVERIFVFSHTKIKEFKDNKTLKIFMQSNINTMYVDLDELLAKEPELLEILGAGWDGIDNSTLIVDIPSKDEARGYISINKKEIEKVYKCYLSIKAYAKDLKEILK